jgi:predicted transglutaminase-like cysteine proteinase
LYRSVKAGRNSTLSKYSQAEHREWRKVKKSVGLIVVAAMAVSFFSAGSASAYAPHNWRPNNSQSATLPPLGFQLFCLKNPAQCKSGGSSSQSLNSGVLRQIRQVNNSVNHSMRARNDVGVDNWTVGGGSGDCEDFALTKRAALIRQGLSASALRIAYVKIRSGEGHAVLVVHTNRGDYVLDNLTSQIKTLGNSGLRVISMSGANPRAWNNA